MPLTDDPTDPRLGHGSDETPIPQHEVYLVLSEEERAKDFVRPVVQRYVHAGPLGCGSVTHMGLALSETYARKPDFYGSTYCVGCSKHRPVGIDGEFYWCDEMGLPYRRSFVSQDKDDDDYWKVGT